MNRRGFFGALAAIAATATLDPERALWVSGKKLISIPAPPGLMTVDEMLNEAIRRLGYVRPLRDGQLADTFLEMTAMVDQWARDEERHVAIRAYTDSAAAVYDASTPYFPRPRNPFRMALALMNFPPLNPGSS